MLMKRLALTALLLLGASPALACSTMLGCAGGVSSGGGGGGGGTFSTPTTVPSASSNFNPNQSYGYVNNALQLNGGVAGSMRLPANAPDSAAFYGEMIINQGLGGGSGIEVPFGGMELNHNTTPGAPNFFFQRTFANGNWWLNPGQAFEVGGSANGGSGYTAGFFPYTVPTSITNCIRQPTGVWAGGFSQQIDPGFGCPTPASAPSLNAAAIAANIPGSGAQQATSGTTCAVVNGKATVTTSVAVAHGITPGQTYPMALFTPTGYNGSYTALPGTGTPVTTLVGTTGATSCPAVVSAEGNALGGTGASITFPLASTTNPWSSGSTGIAVHNGQHVCFWLGENGDNSAFPGSQFFEMVDDKGVPVVGSPALVPYLNQGTANFTGAVAGAVLTASAMNAYTGTGSWASYSSGTGNVTFTTTTIPDFYPGSEFTVTGMSPGGFNQTYVAVAGTAGTTIVGSPLSGPAGTLQANNPGASTGSGGQFVSVILPGSQILGATAGSLILPWGTNSKTGVGGVGTYALSTSSGTLGSGTRATYNPFYFTAVASGDPGGITLTANTGSAIGDFFSLLGSYTTSLSGTINAGWGGALGNIAALYGPLPLQAGGAPSTTDLASICTKTTDIRSYATAKGLTVPSLWRLNDPGIWGDSGIADFTGHTATNQLTVDSTQYGSLPTVTASSPVVIISGPGFPPAGVQITSGSAGVYTLASSVGTISSEPMKAGAFRPALPNQASTMKGWIDTTSGVSTLHVPSLDDGTAHSGFVTLTGAALSGGTLTSSSVSAGISQGMVVTDGGVHITGPPLLITSFGCTTSCSVASNYYPSISAETMTATFTTLVPGEYIQNANITNPVKIVAYSGACGVSGAVNGLLGCYILSGPPNAAGFVGSTGAQQVFTGTTITDGGAIAPGPALTIQDRGPAVTFPITNASAKTGTLTLSGTYSTSALGGTPSGIQVLVSNTANGPALAGCIACNWGALTATTISGGKWSGTIANIPGGGPYSIKVCATNSSPSCSSGNGAYATMTNPVKIGWVFALWGQGQADSMQGNQSGINTSFFSAGLWGLSQWNPVYGGNDHYLVGPPIVADFVPNRGYSYAGDRFGVASGGNIVSEAIVAFDQTLSGQTGVPTSFIAATRDGTGAGLYVLGNAAQTQTVGVGDGSTLAWCSSSTFCPSAGVSPVGPLFFNAASLTGAWFTGATITNPGNPTFNAGTRWGGALEPGLVLNTPNAPALVRCLTSCSSQTAFGGSTWLLSHSLDTGAIPTRADPVGGAPWPNLNIQTDTSTTYNFGGGVGFGMSIVKAGTFTLSINGTPVCQDSSVFAYNQTGGNCGGTPGNVTVPAPTIASSFVNYRTGAFDVVFTAGHAPASGASITASFTNIVSPEGVIPTPQNIDFFGDLTGCQSGADAALFCQAPGGINGHIYSGEGTDKTYMLNQNAPTNVGYQWGGIGYSQMVGWLFYSKFPALIPGASPNVSAITTGQWRVEGPQAFVVPNLFLDGVHDQWTQDFATQSIISGQIASGVLTLKADTTYPMWNGEILNCAPVTSNCTNGPLSGVYITSLTGGAWGKNGSTYALAGSPTNVSVTSTMQNPVYYSGPGSAFYVGTLNDITVQNSGLSGTIGRQPHTWIGPAGGRRATSRWAAMIYCHNGGNCDDPKIDRVKADAVGCNTSAIAAPCFDIGNTYAASAIPTGGTATTLVFNGLAAHARPIVVGQVASCSGCATGIFVTSVSNPPTQSTVAGQGQIGSANNGFVVGLSASGLGWTSGAVTFGCSGVAGTGSNCIDVAISFNGSGVTAIDNCGANNLNGASANYVQPTGACQGNGIGEIVRGLRVGTNQLTNGNGNNGPTAGSVFDDGIDPAN
jgi:hypothetical protein